MTESFLHYLWENKLFKTDNLISDTGDAIQILHPGYYNTNSGPDFFNAQLKIGNTLWAGNIEIHINSSDWLKHNHQNDPAYDGVLLHVVYYNDVKILRKDSSIIPTIELKGLFQEQLWGNFLELISKNHWVACAEELSTVPTNILNNVLEEKVEERLRFKSHQILISLNGLKGDWEECLYQYLAKNFGFQINSLPFEMLARSIPLKVLRNEMFDKDNLNSLLYGQGGMMDIEYHDHYPKELQKKYFYFQSKYKLKSLPVSYWKYLRMRPVNFPTIRIAQFSALVTSVNNLFSVCRELRSKEEFYQLFSTPIHPYWDDHFLFDKPSTPLKKNIGNTSIDNIIINTFIPFQFAWGHFTNEPVVKRNAVDLLRTIHSEKNHLVEKWKEFGVKAKNAADGQALIQLKRYHCEEKKCLTCAIGKSIISIHY